MSRWARENPDCPELQDILADKADDARKEIPDE
jgi:hypothetical protein